MSWYIKFSKKLGNANGKTKREVNTLTEHRVFQKKQEITRVY